MFWKRHSPGPEEGPAREVPEYVRERLRLAFEFATLGAYEQRELPLPAPECGDEPEPARPSQDHGGRPRPQPGRQPAPCVEGATRVPCDAAQGRAIIPRPLGARRRRAGTPVAPEQPCVWRAPGAQRFSA